MYRSIGQLWFFLLYTYMNPYFQQIFNAICQIRRQYNLCFLEMHQEKKNEQKCHRFTILKARKRMLPQIKVGNHSQTQLSEQILCSIIFSARRTHAIGPFTLIFSLHTHTTISVKVFRFVGFIIIRLLLLLSTSEDYYRCL